MTPDLKKFMSYLDSLPSILDKSDAIDTFLETGHLRKITESDLDELIFLVKDEIKIMLPYSPHIYETRLKNLYSFLKEFPETEEIQDAVFEFMDSLSKAEEVESYWQN